MNRFNGLSNSADNIHEREAHSKNVVYHYQNAQLSWSDLDFEKELNVKQHYLRLSLSLKFITNNH